MKKQTKKLVLSKETVRTLEKNLIQVRGASNAYQSCFPYYCQPKPNIYG